MSRVLSTLTIAVLALAVLMGADSAASADNGGGLDAIGLLREFGFPTFVSLWFMWRVEKRMDRFMESIQNLLTAVTIMAKTVDDLHDDGRRHGRMGER